MYLESIDFNQLPFSKLFQTYIQNFQKVTNFYNGNPLNEEEIGSYYKKFQFKGDREKIVELIKQFNEPYDLDGRALQNIEKLKDENTVTIVTGQQLGVYGGPLYTIYKAMTAIAWARKLEEKTGKNVVPVFWMADEDHDYEEIAAVNFPNRNAVNFPNRNEVHTCILSGFDNNKKPVSDLVIPENFKSFRDEIKENLRETDFSAELWNMLDECYQPGITFRKAFGTLISRIFSKHGMILAGSNDKKIKDYLADTIVRSIENASEIGERLNQKSESLANEFHQQAQTDSSLLFLMEEDRRNRISFESGKWNNSGNHEWSSEELLQLVEKQPDRFSPNVFLRPILQDKLLPNAAYVAGPGELAYYGQMKGLYKIFDLEMPFIIPRLSATLIESSITRVMKELPFQFSDYNQRIEDLESHYVEQANIMDVNAFFNEWKKEVAKLSEQKSEEIKEIDPTLKGAAEKATSSYYHTLDALKGKVFRAIKQQNDIQLKRIRKIHMNLFPERELQERKVSFIYYMNKYGLDIWDQILENLENETAYSHKVIYL